MSFCRQLLSTLLGSGFEFFMHFFCIVVPTRPPPPPAPIKYCKTPQILTIGHKFFGFNHLFLRKMAAKRWEARSASRWIEATWSWFTMGSIKRQIEHQNLSGLSSLSLAYFQQSVNKQYWHNLDKGRDLLTFLGRKTVTGTREREYPVCVQASQQQPFQMRLFVRIFFSSIFALARNGSPKNEADMWWKLSQKKWTSCCHRESLDSTWRHSASTAFRSAAWSCAYLILASSSQGSTAVV